MNRLAKGILLNRHQLFATGDSQVKQAVHFSTVEAAAILGRALDFNKFPLGRVGDVHIHFGAGIIVIVEIEADFTVYDTDADC